MSDDPQGAQGYSGQMGLSDLSSEYNQFTFIIQQMLGLVRTVVPVEVSAINPGAGLLLPGTVDVRPLINQIDGVGNSSPHGTVLSLIYLRLQGGDNAVVIDPAVGDKGIALVCDRDISAVKATGAAANPGSYRRFSLADGIYVGGILSAAPPLQSVQFTAAGVIIADRNGNQVQMAPGFVNIVTASFRVNGIPVTIP